MATPFNLHTNVADAAARRRIEKLRSQGRFIEARQGNVHLSEGEAVLKEAAEADINTILKGGVNDDQD